MATPPTTSPASPWRRIFEDVRRAIGNERDSHGIIGSINWLRKQMETRGANPNVVRNIIYRDKGKLSDKRILFDILNDLWVREGNPPLQAPELEVLLAQGSGAEQEVLQLLGREKRRAYRTFVGGVRNGDTPRLLVIGRPGSGKTLLSDYIQQALEIPPRAADRIVRLDFTNDLGASLSRFARALEVSDELMESRLVKIGASSAFSVQADAQADLARVLLDAIRAMKEKLVLLLHVSQTMQTQDSLGGTPLRLNTPEVPRVTASDWLWLSLFNPVSSLPNVSILVTMIDIPARVQIRPGAFEGPLKLNPPTVTEARRFVKARLKHLPASQQELIVQRAGRSYEELRTLTLLAETRQPLDDEVDDRTSLRHIAQLANLVNTSGEARLRNFLASMAVLSIPEFPAFSEEILLDLRPPELRNLSSLEQAFLDPVPGEASSYRCFSRQLARALRHELQKDHPDWFTELNRQASRHYREAAEADSASEHASRYLHHLLEAREWSVLEAWLRQHSVQQTIMRRLWHAATEELQPGPLFEALARQVAAHYVKLGSYSHPDTQKAFSVLEASERQDVRAWTILKRAEGEVLRGRFEQAQELISTWTDTHDQLLNAEAALVRASIARWHSELDEAARLVNEEARPRLGSTGTDGSSLLVRTKVAAWAGLIAKDRGDFEGALREFASAPAGDDLIAARLAFQTGDIQLRLGRFDAALGSFNQAVRLSHRSEALVQEQTRYLARRGTLFRLQGDLPSAAQDFAAARATLRSASLSEEPLEHRFWLARVTDEEALNLLAEGQFAAAIFQLEDNIAAFEQYQAAHQVDASFRILRASLFLGLAYGFRGLGRPFHQPLCVDPQHGNPDLEHAWRILEPLLDRLEVRAAGRHYGGLRLQAQLTASLLHPEPQASERLARSAVESACFPYQRAQGLAFLAQSLIRQAAFQKTLESTLGGLHAHQAAAGGERGDLGLLVWLQALALQAEVGLEHRGAAAERLRLLLEDRRIAQLHEPLLQVFGQAVESHGQPEAWLDNPALEDLLGLRRNPLHLARLRLGDALVARWQLRAAGRSLIAS